MKQLLIIIMLLISKMGIGQTASLQELLRQYLDLKNQLVESNAANAQKSATVLNGKIENLSAQALSEKEAKAFSSLKDVLNKHAKELSSQSDLAKQRVAFAALSQPMIDLFKIVSVKESSLYVDYCPMKKAYWLSTEKTIRNPYYGNAMLSCGSIKETIKE
ncbi:hypothetical protein KACHI17_20850 [Sediminibacterium sp. KACHI17]|uniref:DUF3347 domain-containing protein n=1 Tax=Sediminibacterium sp. KACHI17 TaxID=1751071 RepID=A0AAT9GKT7_9BACT